MKILNLYAGIGGNRKMWPEGNEITAVENNEQIAKIYSDFFPKDKIVIADAHDYLLKHFEEFDFIWSSPPCPSHSRARYWSSKGGRYGIIYPDMTLYQEIILLQNFFKGKYVVENTISYYEPLIKPQKIGRHYIWANFMASEIKIKSNYIFGGEDKKRVEQMIGLDISGQKISDKTKILRNCVEPELGLHIFNCAFGKKQQEQLL